MKPTAMIQPAFTFIELSIALLIFGILLGFGLYSMQTIIQDVRFKDDVAKVDGMIQKTLSHCLSTGKAGRVIIGKAAEDEETVTDKTLRGFTVNTDDSLTEVFRVELEYADFTRESTAPSPWHNSELAGVASSLETDTLMITATGMVESGGSMFLNYRGHEAVLEIMANGSIDTFYYEVNSAGEDVWAR